MTKSRSPTAILQRCDIQLICLLISRSTYNNTREFAARRGSHPYDWAALVHEYIHFPAVLPSKYLVKAYNLLLAVHCKLQGCLVSALYQVSRSSMDALASTSGALNTMGIGYGSRETLWRLQCAGESKSQRALLVQRHRVNQARPHPLHLRSFILGIPK